LAGTDFFFFCQAKSRKPEIQFFGECRLKTRDAILILKALFDFFMYMIAFVE
jgi:hypothetical protein